jgi:hypothetical protein
MLVSSAARTSWLPSSYEQHESFTTLQGALDKSETAALKPNKFKFMQILASIEPEAADMSETPDGEGSHLLMSRRHIWHEHVTRRIHSTTQTLHGLREKLEQRLRDDATGLQPQNKRRCLFEEYQMQQWALESLSGIAADNEARLQRIAARRQEIAAEKARLQAELFYAKVRTTMFWLGWSMHVQFIPCQLNTTQRHGAACTQTLCRWWCIALL